MPPSCHLKDSLHTVVLQKSIPAQIRELIFCISDNKGRADGFVRGLTFARREQAREMEALKAEINMLRRKGASVVRFCLAECMY